MLLHIVFLVAVESYGACLRQETAVLLVRNFLLETTKTKQNKTNKKTTTNISLDYVIWKYCVIRRELLHFFPIITNFDIFMVIRVISFAIRNNSSIVILNEKENWLEICSFKALNAPKPRSHVLPPARLCKF